MNLNNSNIILKSLQEAEKIAEAKIPAGYTPIQLSTKGLIGAPSKIHVRNFKVGEILALSLTGEPDLPARLIEILNDAIYEDVDVGNWSEKEVEELMLYIFLIFYSPVLTDVEFPLTESDYKYVQENKPELYQDLINKKWIPRVDINLADSVNTYELPSTFNSKITITNNKTHFYVTFDYVKYKDQLTVKRWIDSFFKKEELQFKQLKEKLNFNEEIQNKSNQLGDVTILEKLIDIDEEELTAYKAYTSKRVMVLSEILRIVTIVDFNGEDVSNLSLSEKYEKLANDPRIDYGMIKALNRKQSKLKFGLKPEVDMINPITGKPCERRFSFRIPSILFTMQIQGSSQYDDRDDD